MTRRGSGASAAAAAGARSAVTSSPDVLMDTQWGMSPEPESDRYLERGHSAKHVLVDAVAQEQSSQPDPERSFRPGRTPWPEPGRPAAQMALPHPDLAAQRYLTAQRERAEMAALHETILRRHLASDAGRRPAQMAPPQPDIASGPAANFAARDFEEDLARQADLVKKGRLSAMSRQADLASRRRLSTMSAGQARSASPRRRSAKSAGQAERLSLASPRSRSARERLGFKPTRAQALPEFGFSSDEEEEEVSRSPGRSLRRSGSRMSSPERRQRPAAAAKTSSRRAPSAGSEGRRRRKGKAGAAPASAGSEGGRRRKGKAGAAPAAAAAKGRSRKPWVDSSDSDPFDEL